MITIKCINPICGRDFLFDEVKSPDSVKVRCFHCKTIQDLPIKTEIANDQNSISQSETIKPIVLQGDDDFGDTYRPTIIPVIEPVQPKRSRNLILISIFTITFIGILAFFVFRNKNPDPIIIQKEVPVMPDYKINVTTSDTQITKEKKGYKLTLNIEVTPVPDTNTIIKVNEGNKILFVDASGAYNYDTTFSNFETKKIKFKLEVSRLIDNSYKIDSTELSLDIKPTTKISRKSTTKPITVYDFYKNTDKADWIAIPFNTKQKSITYNGTANIDVGNVANANNATLEDNSKKNGIEIVTGKTNGSKIYGEFEGITSLENNSIFSAIWGFKKIDVNIPHPSVTLEIILIFSDDKDPVFIYRSQKKYGDRLLSLNITVPQYKNIAKIRINVIKTSSTNSPAHIVINSLKITKQ